jgi:hypothetical protein
MLLPKAAGATGSPRAQTDPAYRRALLTVVVLNLGFGVAELFGGFIADSQALKADSSIFSGTGRSALSVFSRLPGPHGRGQRSR